MGSEQSSIGIRDVIDHLLLSALWGGSFLFMRISAPEFGPVALIGLRCLIGAITLIAIIAVVGNLRHLKQKWYTGMAIGVINSAIPFVLLAFAALTIGSGLLSIINALAPFWGALIGWLLLRSSLTRWQYVGLVVGFLGVALLIVSGPKSLAVGSRTGLLAVGACVLATVFYGYSAVFAKQYLQGTQPMVNAVNSQIGAAIVLLIPTIVLWPEGPVSITAWLSLLALGVFSTGFAYVLYFRLIDKIGASRAITVVFVVPFFAVIFGRVLLQETLSAVMIVAGLVIMLGSALSLKLIPFSRSAVKKSAA